SAALTVAARSADASLGSTRSVPSGLLGPPMGRERTVGEMAENSHPTTGTDPASDAVFDSKQFRTVLGHFPTGVTVVTGLQGDAPVGFTIGSFTSVSLDPPMVGFLPQTDSDTWAAMAPGERFCVNVLSAEQSDL